MNQDMEMFSFHNRLESFAQWPHVDCNCTPEKLADAGWFMIGTANEPDLVKCYYCQREIDGWEPEDDPWEEHLRRSGDPCPFIKKGKKARELTVKDGLELEGDRLCYILKKKTEESNTRYREEAETVKQLIFEMGKKAQKPSRGRPKRK